MLSLANALLFMVVRGLGNLADNILVSMLHVVAIDINQDDWT